MSSLISTPKNVPGGFTPALQPQQPGQGPAPVTAAPPTRFETTPQVRSPVAPTKDALLAGPNAVPFDAFHKIVAGNPKLAEEMAPGITGPKGYLLLQPDATTGAPLVKLKDPIAFAALANKATRAAEEKIANGGRVTLDPIGGTTMQMDPIESGGIGDAETVASGLPSGQAEMMRNPEDIQTRPDMGYSSGDAVEPSAVQPGDFATALPGLFKSLGAAGLKKLASLVEEKGAEQATKIFFGSGEYDIANIVGKKAIGPRQMGFGATNAQEAKNAALQGWQSAGENLATAGAEGATKK